jgi:hypothetical protein
MPFSSSFSAQSRIAVRTAPLGTLWLVVFCILAWYVPIWAYVWSSEFVFEKLWLWPLRLIGLI